MEIAAHYGVVIENAGGSVLTGKHTTLIRQIHARRVDEVDDRDAAAHGDLLRAQNLLDRLRPPRARFDSSIVGDHDRFAPVNPNDRRDYAGSRCLALVLVVRHEKADLQHARALVVEELDALARRELSLLVQLLESPGAAGFTQFLLECAYLFAQRAQAVAHYASCFSRVANHSLMYAISSLVGVPGPNSRPIPFSCRASTSSLGMMPPPVIRMSSLP